MTLRRALEGTKQLEGALVYVEHDRLSIRTPKGWLLASRPLTECAVGCDLLTLLTEAVKNWREFEGS